MNYGLFILRISVKYSITITVNFIFAGRCVISVPLPYCCVFIYRFVFTVNKLLVGSSLVSIRMECSLSYKVALNGCLRLDVLFSLFLLR
jgi:hypothetical protein